MTHAELYEIVKDHPDVWGQHFHTVRRSNETTELVRHFSNEQPEPEHLQAELLGLGVAWLLETTTEFHAEYKDGPQGFACMVLCGRYPREYKTKLAAVYAAIAEVKRAK